MSISYLARVLASLQVSSTEHGASDLARVGAATVAVRQDGNVQALQLVTVIPWRYKTKWKWFITTTEKSKSMLLSKHKECNTAFRMKPL